MQLALTTPNFVIQEMSLGIHYNVGHDLLSYMRNPEVFDVKDGMVEALAGAGLGVEINEELVREVAAQPHNWRNPIWRGADGSFREW